VGVGFFPTDEIRRRKLKELLELNVRIEARRSRLARRAGGPEHVGDHPPTHAAIHEAALHRAGEGFTDDQDAFDASST